MPEKKICDDPELGKYLLDKFNEFTKALEETLRAQEKQGFDVKQALKDLEKARRIVRQAVR